MAKIPTRLPPFPVYALRRELSPDDFQNLLYKITNSLVQIYREPSEQSPVDLDSFLDFLSSYASDVNVEMNFTGGLPLDTKPELQRLHKYVFLVLDKLVWDASRPLQLPAQALMDVAVLYRRNHVTRVRELFANVLKYESRRLMTEIEEEVIPTLSDLLADPTITDEPRLVFLRYCLALCDASPRICRVFSRNLPFMKAMSNLYTRLMDSGDQFFEHTVAVMDCFHLAASLLIVDVQGGAEASHLLDVLKPLLHPEGTTVSPGSNLLWDYAEILDLQSKLSGISENLDKEDSKSMNHLVDRLPSMSLSSNPPPTQTVGTSANIQPQSQDKGKQRETQASPSSRTLDMEAVLEILPDQDSEYIRRLLESYPGPEQVIAALLDGSAPPDAPMIPSHDARPALPERHNIFNTQEVDTSRFARGKKKFEPDYVEPGSMKADILRRAEAMFQEELEEEEAVRTVAFDEELEDSMLSPVGLPTRADADESDQEQLQARKSFPEAILELAYLEDPKLFDRDAATRRSSARASLKAKTGWHHEQIEGWKIALERNPHKDRILAKHEFSGNLSLALPDTSEADTGDESRSHKGPNRAANRGRGHGRGRGGAGVGNNTPTDRERSTKEKNKAHRSNHDRRKGHDRKMARGGAL